jgi:hypothetical protein
LATTDAHAGQRQGDELPAVGQLKGDHVAAPDAQAYQAAGNAVDPGVEFPVTETYRVASPAM